MRELCLGDTRLTLLGTAHVSRASASEVSRLLASGEYDAVALELCPSRLRSLIHPEELADMDLFGIIRAGRAPMVIASLALGAYQQRLAEQFGIEPGAEMRAAVEAAEQRDLPLILIDREIGISLRRLYRGLSWWRRLLLISGLFGSLLAHEEVTEESIEALKEGDVLETTFAQFADSARDLYVPLIEERDRYMAARLLQCVGQGGHRRVLAVVGAGHLEGISRHLRVGLDDPAALVTDLERVPPRARWPRLIPWLIVMLVLAGFALGFSRGSDLGWALVLDWVLINGGLSALGTLLAGGHPLTILTAFVAAPLTSLNPAIGAGMVTAAVETVLRRPTVADFQNLRHAVTHLGGWRENRVARILLVFILSTLGSAIGTYLAGFRIAGSLFG